MESIAKQTKSKNFIYKILFIVYLLANFVLSVYRHFNYDYSGIGYKWQNVEMLMSYKYGFTRRGFMGTVAFLLSKAFGLERYDTIRYVQLAGEIVFCIMITVLIVYFISLCKKETTQNIIIFLSAVFLQLAGFGFYIYDWGEPDIYMASLTIIAVMLIVSKRCIFLVIPISCICEMIHEGYALMFFPVVFALLFYYYCKEDDKTKKKKYFVVLFLTTLFTAVLFFYFYFFSTPIKNFTAEEVLTEFKGIYDEVREKQHTDNIKYIWFGAKNYFMPFTGDKQSTSAFILRMSELKRSSLFMLPSLLFFIVMWVSRAVKFKNCKHKWAELAVFFSISVVIPLFVIHSDAARWWYDVVFYEYIILSVITITDGENTVEFFEKCKLLNNWFVKVIFVLYIIVSTIIFRFNKWAIIVLDTNYYILTSKMNEIYHMMFNIRK